MAHDFAADTLDRIVKKGHSLTVVSGHATLDVPLYAETYLSFAGDPWTFPVGSSTAKIEPAVSLKDVYLEVPDPKVFPEYNPPTDDRNRYTFNDLFPGVLGNPAWVARFVGTPAAPYVNYTTFQSFDIGAPCVKTSGAKSVGADTISQQFTYTELPSLNSDFGNKQVTLVVNAPDLSTNQTANVQIFFRKYRGIDQNADSYAYNHPNGENDDIPNWFFYWKMTSAYYGNVEYKKEIEYSGITQFVGGVWKPFVCKYAARTSAAGAYDGAEGIDFFANICRHEMQHYTDNTNLLWGNRDRNDTDDPDHDYLPTDVLMPGSATVHVKEHDLGAMYHPTLPGGGYDPNATLTMGLTDHMHYGDGFNDGEDFTKHRQVPWTNGTADKEDWAYPGKQWWMGMLRY